MGKKVIYIWQVLHKRLDENSNQGYLQCSRCWISKKIFNLHSDLPFLPKRNNIKKCNKLVCNIQDKGNYVVYIRALKQALNHGLILKKYIK